MKKWFFTSVNYLKWHYGKALISTFYFWENILIFLFHYLSIKGLAYHLFSPWKRLTEPYTKGFDIKAKFNTFIINTMMRIVGLIIRIPTLLLGVLFLIIFIGLLPLTLLIWLLLPLLVIFLIGFGTVLIFFA